MNYIRGTVKKFILIKLRSVSQSPLEAFSDSDWAGCLEIIRSITGISIKVNNVPIFWTSKRQSLISVNSAEPEHSALLTCSRQAIWPWRLTMELKCNAVLMEKSVIPPKSLFTDSSAAISLVAKQQGYERKKRKR